jgi:hypothetical protein
MSNHLNGSLRNLDMPPSERDFRVWSYRNGGETYGRSDDPGIAHHFPDTDSNDHVIRISEDAFEVATEDRFYSTRLLNQHAESWIDDDDRLHIDTEDARIAVDSR